MEWRNLYGKYENDCQGKAGAARYDRDPRRQVHLAPQRHVLGARLDTGAHHELPARTGLPLDGSLHEGARCLGRVRVGDGAHSLRSWPARPQGSLHDHRRGQLGHDAAPHDGHPRAAAVPDDLHGRRLAAQAPDGPRHQAPLSDGREDLRPREEHEAANHDRAG